MTALPIDAFLPQITASLRDRGVLVLVAEPGAGKTTRVPPAILDAGLVDDVAHPQLVMLQPRRVAARAAAARIADERGVPLGGDDVGYQVRFDRKVTDKTRLRVLTEGILTRQLVADPFLDRVGCVVLDEFHERSLDVDLAIALLREIRRDVRPDLKLVVMSATLDAEAVATFLADDRGPAPVVRVPGRTFPVEVEYRMPSERRVWERVADEVERAFTLGSDPAGVGLAGDVLVFLPGAHEIDRAIGALDDVADRLDLDVRPLHGSLSFEEQQRALADSDRPRVICATNIAETSLTIDGVTTVIDAGLARVPRFDARTGLDRLELGRISQASATQRAGRAGRTGPGRCVRLWTSREQHAMDPFELPEIRRVDLAPTVLNLRAWGTNDPRAFGWFDRPDDATIDHAEELLAMLGAIDGPRGGITPVGQQLSRLPVHPRVGRMLLAGVAWGVTELACTFAAILSERDFVRDDDAYATRAPRTIGASDLSWRAMLLAGDGRDGFIDRQTFMAARRVREDLLRTARRLDVPREPSPPTDEIELILPLLGYPDRVCRRRENDQQLGVRVGGGGVRLHPSSVCREGPFFVALDARADDRDRTQAAQVRIASRVEPAWLERLLPQSVRRERAIEYDASRGRVVARSRVSYADLMLREATDQLRAEDDAAAALVAGLRGDFDNGRLRSPSTEQLIARLNMIEHFLPPHLRPKETGGGSAPGAVELLERACELAAAAGDATREGVLRRLDDAARHSLEYRLVKLLDDHAPESIEVPTGSQIKLDWTTASVEPPRGPVMAVRLQELFGTPETPRVLGGTVKVVLHLLGPNYRPVQVTDDLASFWRNTYPQVRKDLRARYPKHSWPDDPLTADAIRGPRRRGT